jgi:hypothetical protein
MSGVEKRALAALALSSERARKRVNVSQERRRGRVQRRLWRTGRQADARCTIVDAHASQRQSDWCTRPRHRRVCVYLGFAGLREQCRTMNFKAIWGASPVAILSILCTKMQGEVVRANHL